MPKFDPLTVARPLQTEIARAVKSLPRGRAIEVLEALAAHVEAMLDGLQIEDGDEVE